MLLIIGSSHMKKPGIGDNNNTKQYINSFDRNPCIGTVHRMAAVGRGA
jgi:hypothetical protein